jgi:hypothetical protein
MKKVIETDQLRGGHTACLIIGWMLPGWKMGADWWIKVSEGNLLFLV